MLRLEGKLREPVELPPSNMASLAPGATPYSTQPATITTCSSHSLSLACCSKQRPRPEPSGREGVVLPVLTLNCEFLLESLQ